MVDHMHQIPLVLVLQIAPMSRLYIYLRLDTESIQTLHCEPLNWLKQMSLLSNDVQEMPQQGLLTLKQCHHNYRNTNKPTFPYKSNK